MLFSSIPFLYYFLPVVLLVYFLAPRILKNSVLLLSSLVFYAWGEPKYVVLMAVTILSGYISGLLIEKTRGTKISKLLLFVSTLIITSFLIYFKYADFFIANFNAVTGLSVKLLKIALPIGISFYTFQILSYTVDVYRGEPAQKNIIDLAAYVTMFPQLIAGPIVRYSDIALQLRERKHTAEYVALGIRRFVIGLGKKILIANQLGELCDIFKGSDEKSLLFFWVYAVAYALHVYFDFSGYSDMAIGLGKIFGFDFLENFNYPFISKSVTEFWRRWHMSLGSWFRDYLYIPLGGNRVNTPRWLFNILVVWMFTGFWHGAAWNFIIWGLFFAVLLVVEKFVLMKFLKRSGFFGRICVLVAVMVSFVIFDSVDLVTAGKYISSMFGFGGYPMVTGETLYYLSSFGLTIIIGIIGATPIPKIVAAKLFDNRKTSKFMNIIEPVFLFVMLIVTTAYLVDGSFNPFLYFRF